MLSSLSKGLLAKLQEGLDFKLQMREPLQQVSGTLPESERVMTVIWFDIVVFAAVAAFLAYRLYSVLGEKNDNEREQPNPFVLPPRDAAETPPPGPRARLPAMASRLRLRPRLRLMPRTHWQAALPAFMKPIPLSARRAFCPEPAALLK